MDAYLLLIDKIVENILHYAILSTLDLKSTYQKIPTTDHEKPYTAFKACGDLYQFLSIHFQVTNGIACFQRTIKEVQTTEGSEDNLAHIDNVTVYSFTKAYHPRNLTRVFKAAAKNGSKFNTGKTVTIVAKLYLLGYFT